MKIIVAVDTNWGIGRDNDLLFKLTKDMKYFKDKTLNKVVVMGHNTLLSFPNGEPLKDRKNIVVSQIFKSTDKYDVADNLDELFTLLMNFNSKDIFVIGGEMLYRTMLDYCDEALITKVYCDGRATHFFPNLDTLSNWTLSEESERIEDNGYLIRFTKYKNNSIKIFNKK